VFNLSANLSSTSGNFTYTFYNGSQLLFEFSGNATGNWSQSNTSNNPTPDKVIYDGGITFIVMGIEMTGNLDFKDLYPVLNNDTTNQNQAEQQAVVNAINNYLKLTLEHTGGNVIATSNAYLTSGTDTIWVYNPNTYQYVPQVQSTYLVNMRLAFPDGTTADLNTYVNQGFGDFVTELNSFFQDLATNFGFTYTPIVYHGKKK